MTRNTSFVRKVIYLSAIAVLFIPLSLISAPAKNAEEGGGVLSRMRREERLSLAQIGKIDPASASIVPKSLVEIRISHCPSAWG